MKFREVIELLESQGFEQTRQSGSHRTYVGYVKDRKHVVTVAYRRLNDDVAKGTLASIRRQSGLRRKLFKR